MKTSLNTHLDLVFKEKFLWVFQNYFSNTLPQYNTTRTISAIFLCHCSIWISYTQVLKPIFVLVRGDDFLHLIISKYLIKKMLQIFADTINFGR